jgi:hypothetical protein
LEPIREGLGFKPNPSNSYRPSLQDHLASGITILGDKEKVCLWVGTTPQKFLRQAPNALLARYCQEKEILAEVDFASLSETNIGPIYEAWDRLPSETRRMMESDFRNIYALSTENGIRAIIDAAKAQGDHLDPIFTEMDGFFDKALWTFFERQSLFEVALLFVNADNLPVRYWRKRKDLLKMPMHKDEIIMQEFADALSYYFRKNEGRGHDCTIDYYHRNGLPRIIH